MEAVTGRDLSRFFDAWVYGTAIPLVKLSHRIEVVSGGTDLVVRAEQTSSATPLPLVLTIRYANGSSSRIVVPLTDAITEARLPLKVAVRSVDLEKHANLVIPVRN
jgi:hypothetical protein